MGLLGSVITGTVTHVATGTAVGGLYKLFTGSLTESRANWQVAGLFCSILTDNTTAAFQYQLALSLTVGGGLDNASGTAGSVTGGAGFGTVYTPDAGGTWSISCPVERLIGWYDDSSYQDASGFAIDGGAAVVDSPKRVREVIWERPLAGGTLTCTASLGGTISLTKSIVLTTNDALSNTIAQGETIRAIQSNLTHAGDSCSISGAFDGTALTGTSYNQSVNDVAITDGGNPTVTTNATNRVGTASLLAYLPRSFRADIALRGMNAAYAGSVTVQVVGSGGTVDYAIGGGAGTVSDTQRYANFVASHNGTPGTALIDEQKPLRMWIKASSLSDNGEPTTSWRLMMKSLPKWDCLSVITTGTVTLYSSAGTAGASPFTISLPDATTDAGLKGTAWSGASLQFGRYLAVEAKIALAPDQVPTLGGTSSPATLTLGAKQWNRDYLGGTLNFGSAGFTTGTVDLCGPTNGTAFYSTQDTRFPLVGPSPYSVTDDANWGVSNAGSATLTSADGGTVTIKSLKMVQIDHAKLHVTPTYDNWISAGDGSEYRIDSFWGERDYRKSLETIDVYRTGSSYSERTIGEVIASLNGAGSAYPMDGYSALTFGSADTYRGSAIRACFIGGQGAIYAGGAWDYYTDRTLAFGTTAVPAQLAVDEVTSWVPGTDDHGYGAAGAGTLSIAALHIFRAGVWGIAYQSGNNLPATGSVVTVTDLTENDAGGTATADAYGGYYSGTPFVQGQHGARAQTGGQAIVLTLPENKWMRGGFRTPPGTVGGGLCYDVSAAGRHAIAYQSGGTIVAGMNTDPFGQMYGSVSTGIAGTPTCLMWEQGKQSRLYMLYAAGGSVYVAYTRNEGVGWTMAGTIATSGTAARSVYARDGRKYYFWQGGGTLYSRVYDSTDTALGTAYPIISSGVDNDSIDCKEWTANKGQWRLNVQYRSSGNLITVTTSDGVNYS